MSLYLTAAHSSRVNKPTQKPARRHSSSPFANLPRSKPSIVRTKSLTNALDDGPDHSDGDEGEGEGRLAPSGKILSTISIEPAKDVLTAVKHACTSMFAPLPERAGMNSVRISHVLNFQRNLPSIVTLAHVHALIAASSKTERQIATLQSAGKLRKIKVTGRGNDITGTSEVLITMADWQALLERSDVAPDVVADFCDVLRRQPRATSISSQDLPASHVTTLTRTGFLVSSSLSGSRNLSLAGSSLVAMPKISRAASGTSAAVGGDAAFENLGGVGAARRPKSTIHLHRNSPGSELALSVPNIGPYLRLLNAGRAHLLELLAQSKYKEGPLYLIRERWDGAVDSDNRVSTAKRIRGEFSGVMPAKTKKWKDLYGLNFDWIVEECLGAGLIELFETRSVGLGIRALT
ncbi:uncharacterized protein Z518_05121 [Rhinocladiella mackenziei CBS 650.93]|uniref:Serine-threonine protein kinase 19 n=1 Tax=Rhinocladiella mackenziei CBS 650.93 TaxID=1442369 RepID=A0A0D2IMX5_9EURO|nr:uncharacterized protein Z518_05121 [Rhinocladiella mackenziei CBS 650.93]KIX07144.1 hypothetical protein Z518_05121 [Rhinocladiella mackenziei CBS 650.93]